MSTRATNFPQVTPQPIIEAAFAFGRTQVLVSAVELDIFSHIDNGQHTVGELARVTQTNERGLRMLLNALTAQGYLSKRDRRYQLSEMAKTFLSKKSPAYLGGWTRHMMQIQPAWNKLTEVVRTGRPATTVEGQQDQGEFFSQFVHTLYALGQPTAEAMARKVLADLQHGREIRVLDVGAGSGVWGFALAKLNPKVRVTVADWPKVIESVTRKFAKRDGITERVTYLPGDFHQTDFGENQYDVVTAGHICHGEGPTRTRELFARIRRALKPQGAIVVADFLPDEQRAQAEFPLMFAINMLVHTEEGDTFTWSEYQQWLQEAGFGEVSRLEAPGQATLITACKREMEEKAA